jgi:hypothetical protein
VYEVASAIDPNVLYARPVLLDTAIHIAKEESKDVTFGILVVEKENGIRRCRGWAHKGRFLWGRRCSECDGRLSMHSCLTCYGFGVVEDPIGY